MAHLSTTPTPPLTWEIPGAVKTLLSTARMNALLYGTGRVYDVEDVPAKAEDRETKPWGRVVVMLAQQVSVPGQEYPGREKLARLLVKAEVNDPGGSFSPRRALQAIQLEVFNQLEGKALTLTKAGVMFPLWRVGFVNEEPLWDQDAGVWVQSAEYRCVLEPA